MKKFFKELFEKEWDMDHKVLCIAVSALGGMLIGFLLSPIREGVRVFSNNGCHNGSDNQGNRANAKTYKGVKEDKTKKDKKEEKNTDQK